MVPTGCLPSEVSDSAAKLAAACEATIAATRAGRSKREQLLDSHMFHLIHSTSFAGLALTKMEVAPMRAFLLSEPPQPSSEKIFNGCARQGLRGPISAAAAT